RVYQRRLADALFIWHDVGLPTPGADGALEFVVAPIDLGIPHAFVVSAVQQDGRESPPSNELVYQPRCHDDADCLDADVCTTDERCVDGTCVRDPVICPAPTPCTETACDPARGCTVTAVPDGTGCETEDPCVPGICADGECTAPPEIATDGHFLSVSSF